MSIVIDKAKCRGCGRCAAVCPGSLIARGEGGQCEMKYPKDCWGCCSCIKECPFGAISLYLGADMGGQGGRMNVRREGDLLHWRVKRADGTSRTITVDQKESNQY